MKRTYLLSGTYLLALAAVLTLFASSEVFGANGRGALFLYIAVLAAIIGVILGGAALFSKDKPGNGGTEPGKSQSEDDKAEDGKPNE